MQFAPLLAFAWLGAFFLFVFGFSAVEPAPPPAFAALALAGWAYALAFERQRLADMVARHRVFMVSGWAVVAAILLAGWLLELRVPDAQRSPLPAQVGLLLCLPPLALMLAQRTLAQAVVALFAAICALHVVALPLEAVTGSPVWPIGEPLFPRELGPLNFQARGMAWQVYYFPGLYLSLFYLGAGALGEEQLVRDWRWRPRSWLVASLAWAAAVACLQSRSAFAGALAASIIGLLVFAHVRHPRLWLVALGVAALGAALFWYLFSTNKSSAELRWVYLLLYLRRSFDAEWLWTGRGYTIVPDRDMQVPCFQFVDHAHNDLAQVFFTWGLPALLAYLAFWAGLLRLALRFWRAGRYWPTLALVAAGPSLLTDLGLHHPEKTAFIVLLAAWMVGCDQRRPAPVRP